MVTVNVPIVSSDSIVKATNQATLITSYEDAALFYGLPDLVRFGGDEFVDPLSGGDIISISRGLMQFNTSPLVGQTITKVEFYRVWLSSPAFYDEFIAGVSRNYNISYSIGDFGASIDFTQAEYEAGADCYVESGIGSSLEGAAFLDLGVVGIAGINTTGHTTIKIRNTYNDDYPNNSPDDRGSATYNITTDPCFLRITYESIPGCSPFQLMGGS